MTQQNFSITREIGIDAAHRVPLHGSGCRRLHGHRYRIEAVCSGSLAAEGEQSGMVLDFGFLKAEMMSVIHNFCDHGTILQAGDPLAKRLWPGLDEVNIFEQVNAGGYYAREILVDQVPFKLYFIAGAPTAENLAAHWYERLQPRVLARSSGRAQLSHVIVHETPNCHAVFPDRG